MPEFKRLEDLQTRVAKALLIASSMLIFGISLSDLVLGFWLLAAIKMALILLFVWAYHKLRNEGYKESNTHLVNIPVLVFFSLNFLTNQGIDGPTLAGMLSLFVVYPILLSKPWKWVYTIVTLLLIAVLLLVSIDKQLLFVADYSSESLRVYDHIFTYAAMGVFLTLLVSLVINFYRKQNIDLERARLELSKQVAREEAEKSRKSELLGILAHDVRAPVANLSQIMKLYEREVLSAEAMAGLMDSIRYRLRDLEGTIDNVLGQIHLENTLETDGHESIDPSGITQELTALLRYKFDAKKQTLLFLDNSSRGSRLTKTQVANTLALILRNLLDNAHKYSPEGSEVRIILSDTPKALEWKIIDQGPGIPEEMKDRLFSSSIQSKQGTGVGLYICKSLADRISAALHFDTGSSGTVFTVHFPLEKP